MKKEIEKLFEKVLEEVEGVLEPFQLSKKKIEKYNVSYSGNNLTQSGKVLSVREAYKLFYPLQKINKKALNYLNSAFYSTLSDLEMEYKKIPFKELKKFDLEFHLLERDVITDSDTKFQLNGILYRKEELRRIALETYKRLGFYTPIIEVIGLDIKRVYAKDSYIDTTYYKWNGNVYTFYFKRGGYKLQKEFLEVSREVRGKTLYTLIERNFSLLLKFPLFEFVPKKRCLVPHLKTLEKDLSDIHHNPFYQLRDGKPIKINFKKWKALKHILIRGLVVKKAGRGCLDTYTFFFEKGEKKHKQSFTLDKEERNLSRRKIIETNVEGLQEFPCFDFEPKGEIKISRFLNTENELFLMTDKGMVISQITIYKSNWKEVKCQ